MPLRWFRSRVLKAAAAASGTMLALTFACNTPYIPLPPPADPTFEALTVTDPVSGARTVWQTRGGPQEALAGAKVYVFNATLDAGVITRAAADGSYVAAPIDGKEGDRVELSYERPDGQNGQSVCRLLKAGVAHDACPSP